jgi:cytochrome c biogenesis protein CcmG/thiol:disulfide interchange protein DsbE
MRLEVFTLNEILWKVWKCTVMSRLSLWLFFGMLGRALPQSLCQHALFLEPSRDSLGVTELFHCDNHRTTAAVDDIRVYVPRVGMDLAEAVVERPGNAPARLPLDETTEPDIYKLADSIRPGITRFQVRYALPAAHTFTGRVFAPAPVRLVSSGGVMLSGKNVRFLSREPRSQANLYELVSAAHGESFEVSIDGSADEASPAQEPKRGPARVFGNLSVLLALPISLLCIGSTLLYRRPSTGRLDQGLLVSFVGVLLALLVVTKDAIKVHFAVVGEKAPNFALRTDNGRKINRNSFGGKLLVLNFWATWCQPCLVEMPSLNQFASELSKDGVVVVAVSIDENERAYRGFIAGQKPRFLTARDPASDLAAEFGTFKVPETYVIDETGRVLQKYVNTQNWMDPSIHSEIRRFVDRTK